LLARSHQGASIAGEHVSGIRAVGRVVTVRQRHTVEELARQLGLADNAVRSHLATLERDETVRHAGVRRGVGKPLHDDDLAPEAGQFFLKATRPPRLRSARHLSTPTMRS
jgi:hypothetical protein